jgi:hypothetical protein
MGQRMIRHLVAAGVGVAAAPCLAFLFLDAIRRTAFLSVAMQTSQLPGAGLGVPMDSAWLPAVELAAAAALAGALAGSRWISPVAPLVAALPLFALNFYAYSELGALAGLVRQTPAGLVMPIQEAMTSDAFLLISGALAVSAIAPWRWRTGQPPPRWANWHAVGIIVGMAAIPVLWLVLQLSEGVASNLGPPGILASASEFVQFMIGGAIVMGLLASARWLSPVAALIAGGPLLAAGLFTLLTPATAQGVIVHLVYGQFWQPATEALAASGWLVLFGGTLLAAGMMPGRWRREPRPAPEGPALTPGTTPGQAPNPELAS